MKKTKDEYMKKLKYMINWVGRDKHILKQFCPGTEHPTLPVNTQINDWINKIDESFCPICREIMGVNCLICPCGLYSPEIAIAIAKNKIKEWENEKV